MDDLIVIILTLIVAVIGIIGQTKKKKLAEQQPQTGKAPQSFWDMLDSQIDPEQQFEDENEFLDQEEYENINEIADVVPPGNTYKFEAKNEGVSNIKEKPISEILKTDSKKTKKEKFPLRKAVIYSEILKRKYI